MKRFWLGVAAATLVSACSGGNPWLEDGDGGTDPVADIPTVLLGDLEGFTYDPVAKTLVVRGVSLNNNQFEAIYTRKPGLDVPGYEAYSTQADALTRHSTAYVQQRDGVSATIVVTGGQFGSYFGGSQYTRSGATNVPGSGLIQYAGKYVGLLNVAGDGGDLLPVAPGTPNDIRPAQAAEVTGDVLISADFANNEVEGTVYNRVIVDDAGTDISGQNIDLAPTEILGDGTFVGDAEQGNNDRGTYGGIFGGTDASAVAGTLFVENHINQIAGVEEFGLFVLGKCGEPGSDPVCNQPTP